MENKGKLFLVNEDFVDKPQLDWRERLKQYANSKEHKYGGEHTCMGYNESQICCLEFPEVIDFIAEVEKLAKERGRQSVFKHNMNGIDAPELQIGIKLHSELLAETRSSLKAELIEAGEKIKTKPGSVVHVENMEQWNKETIFGYNQAISDYQALIKGLDV